MNSRFFDVLHDGADHNIGSVADRIDIDFDSVGKEAIDQHGMLGRRLHRKAHVITQCVYVLNDLHRASAEHVGRSHKHRIANAVGHGFGFFGTARDCACGSLEFQLFEQVVEALAIFRAVDGVGRRAEDRHACFFEGNGKLERGLPTKLHDDAVRFFDGDNRKHVFEGKGFEVEAVAGVVVRRNRFGVAVDHDGFVTGFLQGKDRVNAAVVELDPLADAVRTATENHHALALGDIGLALVLVGRIEVRRVGVEFGATGIDSLVDRQNLVLHPHPTHAGFAYVPKFGEAAVREAHLFRVPQDAGAFVRARHREFRLHLDDFVELAQEPGVDPRASVEFIDCRAPSQRFHECPQSLRAGRIDRLPKKLFAFGPIGKLRRLETVMPHLERANRLLHALFEGAPDGHHFADALHLRRQGVVGVRELFEGESRDLRHHVIDAGFETRGRFLGDVVLDFVEGVTNGQLGGDLRDRKTGGL